MTDKLRAAAEMVVEALVNASDALRDGDDAGCRWILYEQIHALRQALDQLPDTTKMIEPEELVCICGAIWQGQELICPPKCLEEGIEREMPIDRGAWSDVPDATKWVDELRGDDEWDHPPHRNCDCKHSTEYWSDVYPQPIGEVQIEELGRPYNSGKVVLHFYGEPPPVGTKLYAAPPKDVVEPVAWIVPDYGFLFPNEDSAQRYLDNIESNAAPTPIYTAPPKPDLLNQTCCECGRSGGYALYCGDCWNKTTEWQGLTDEEIRDIHWSKPMDELSFAREIEAKLKEKNHGS